VAGPTPSTAGLKASIAAATPVSPARPAQSATLSAPSGSDCKALGPSSSNVAAAGGGLYENAAMMTIRSSPLLTALGLLRVSGRGSSGNRSGGSAARKS
jgi:hypothetical protein